MEKTTVLANTQFRIAFTEETLGWMHEYFPDAWFSKGDGSGFLEEYSGRWRHQLQGIITEEIQRYFAALGVPDKDLPYIGHIESFRGSWVMNATVVMRGSVGYAYSVLKKTARDFTNIADGLTALKSKIKKDADPNIRREISESLYSSVNNTLKQARNTRDEVAVSSLPTPPSSLRTLITTDFIIDARPLLSLTPAVFKSHKVHLSVGVSQDAFTLENLGDEPLRDVQIGIFKSRTQRNQWAFQDSFMGNFPLVSARQTVVKDVGEFENGRGSKLEFYDDQEVYVDCWVQDSSGIYLFQFYLGE